MGFIKIDGREFEVDGDGFLINPDIWSKDLAELIAKYDGIGKMTEKHWAVVNHIRSSYERKGKAPMIRTLCDDTGLKLREIYELFPMGPARGACRVAGLPKPDGCI
jgi:TusE/DsrC/DsvC family sulfur relay protein